MPGGGKRAGAGRPRKLSADQCAEIRRSYDQRMQALASTDAYLSDHAGQARWTLSAKIDEKIRRHGRELSEEELLQPAGPDVPIVERLLSKLANRIPKSDWKNLDEEHRAVGNANIPIDKIKRAHGPSDKIIKGLATEYNVTESAIKNCLYRKT